MAQRNRRQISMCHPRTTAASRRLRDSMAEKTGTRVTITDTITRTIDCLEDAIQRGAWLSPREAAPVLEQRAPRQAGQRLGAVHCAHACPEKRLKRIAFDPKNWHDDRDVRRGRSPSLYGPATRTRSPQRLIENMPRLLKIDEAAAELGVPTASLETAARMHGFVVYMGRARRIDPKTLPELIEKCRDMPRGARLYRRSHGTWYDPR